MEKINAFKIIGLTEKEENLTTEQITAVKGLGCLRDKRFDDVFNVRVITRNGKITTDEQTSSQEKPSECVHEYQEQIKVKAQLFTMGKKQYTCVNCGDNYMKKYCVAILPNIRQCYIIQNMKRWVIH